MTGEFSSIPQRQPEVILEDIASYKARDIIMVGVLGMLEDGIIGKTDHVIYMAPRAVLDLLTGYIDARQERHSVLEQEASVSYEYHSQYGKPSTAAAWKKAIDAERDKRFQAAFALAKAKQGDYRGIRELVSGYARSIPTLESEAPNSSSAQPGNESKREVKLATSLRFLKDLLPEKGEPYTLPPAFWRNTKDNSKE